MLDNNSLPGDLILKYLKGSLTTDEAQALEAWISQGNNRQLFERLTNREAIRKDLKYRHELEKENKPEDWQYDASLDEEDLQNEPAPVVRMKKINWKKVGIAAAIVGIIGLLAGLLFTNQNPQPVKVVNEDSTRKQEDDVPAGRSVATLYLTDGRIINVDSTTPGSIVNAVNREISNGDSGIVLKGSGLVPLLDSSYNELSTPLSGNYAMTLPDGTRVWLNAKSTIRVPENFAQVDRKVEISGEVFFIVAEDAQKPFKTLVRRDSLSKEIMEIEVLGTRFNVRAYGDEPQVITTVERGNVKIKEVGKADKIEIVKAGKQAILDSSGLDVGEVNVDVEQVIAWQQGWFIFRQTPIRSIIFQLAKWYGVTPEFDGIVDLTETYSGSVERFKSLQSALDVLRQAADKDLDFKVEGKKLIISSIKTSPTKAF